VARGGEPDGLHRRPPLLWISAGYPRGGRLIFDLQSFTEIQDQAVVFARTSNRTPGNLDLTHMSRKVKESIRAAELQDELTFTSFLHGGFTEAADSDLSDAEIRAQGRHKSAKVLTRYAKRTMKQVAAGAKKRRSGRTEGGHLSE
jgi:hypothetical protein